MQEAGALVQPELAFESLELLEGKGLLEKHLSYAIPKRGFDKNAR